MIYIATNLAGVFAHYPAEHAQREAFLETRGYVETRLKLQRENQEQVSKTTYKSLTISLRSFVDAVCVNVFLCEKEHCI